MGRKLSSQLYLFTLLPGPKSIPSSYVLREYAYSTKVEYSNKRVVTYGFFKSHGSNSLFEEIAFAAVGASAHRWFVDVPKPVFYINGGRVCTLYLHLFPLYPRRHPKYILYTFLPDVQRRAVPLNLTAPL